MLGAVEDVLLVCLLLVILYHAITSNKNNTNKYDSFNDNNNKANLEDTHKYQIPKKVKQNKNDNSVNIAEKRKDIDRNFTQTMNVLNEQRRLSDLNFNRASVHGDNFIGQEDYGQMIRNKEIENSLNAFNKRQTFPVPMKDHVLTEDFVLNDGKTSFSKDCKIVVYDNIAIIEHGKILASGQYQKGSSKYTKIDLCTKMPCNDDVTEKDFNYAGLCSKVGSEPTIIDAKFIDSMCKAVGCDESIKINNDDFSIGVGDVAMKDDNNNLIILNKDMEFSMLTGGENCDIEQQRKLATKMLEKKLGHLSVYEHKYVDQSSNTEKSKHVFYDKNNPFDMYVEKIEKNGPNSERFGGFKIEPNNSPTYKKVLEQYEKKDLNKMKENYKNKGIIPKSMHVDIGASGCPKLLEGEAKKDSDIVAFDVAQNNEAFYLILKKKDGFEEKIDMHFEADANGNLTGNFEKWFGFYVAKWREKYTGKDIAWHESAYFSSWDSWNSGGKIGNSYEKDGCLIFETRANDVLIIDTENKKIYARDKKKMVCYIM